MVTVHTTTKKAVILLGLGKHGVRTQEFLPFKENVTTGIMLYHKLPNHNQWLAPLLHPFKAYPLPCLAITKHREEFLGKMQKCIPRPGLGQTHPVDETQGTAIQFRHFANMKH